MQERRAGVILSYIGIAVSVFMSMVYTPFLLRALGKSEYGLFSLVNTVMAYLTILDFGLGNTIIRYTAKYREIGDKNKESSLYGMFISLYMIIGVIAFAGGMVISINAGTIFAKTLEQGQQFKMSVMVMIASLNIALSFPLGIFSSIMIGYERYFFVNLIGLLQKILTPITMVGILFAGLGSIGLLAGTVVVTVVFNLIRMFFVFKNLNVKIRFADFDLGIFKEIAVFSFFIFLSMIVDKFFWSTDQIILGIEGTNMGDVASYSLAAVFVSAFISVTSVIGHMYLPQFTKMVTRNESDQKISEEFIRISRLQFYVCMLIFGGFIIVGKRFIVDLYAGSEYMDTYYIALIIMSSLVTGITQNVGISVLQAKNMHKVRALVQLLIATMNVVLSVVAVRQYGAIGAAVVTFISHFCGIFVIMSIYYQKVVHLDVLKLWKQLLKIGIKYIALIGVFLFLNRVAISLPIVPYLIVFGLSYVMLYILITYFTAMNEYEVELVKNVLNKLKKGAK